MDNLINEVLDSVRRGYALESGERVSNKRDFSLADMISCIESNPKIVELYQLSTRTAMIQRLRRANRLGVFHPGGTSAQDLAVGGQVTIIDVAPLGSDAESVLAILTNMLSRQVLTYRMAWTDDGTSAREELPPTWLIIDEAHTLVPKSGNTPAKDAIIGYAKLGRRFGCSLVLCTQQPSAVSDDAISQADIIISHSLSHDTDIRALQQRAPAVMPDQFRDKVFISSLPRGVALVFDQTTANKRGFIMQVRPRLSQHGGSDRLSGLFEAAHLMVPDDIEYEPEEVEIEEEVILEEEPLTDLPDVPRPPVKLSKDDWVVLDKWMKDYVETLFEQKMQDFEITEEPGPRADEPEAIIEPAPEPTPAPVKVTEDPIDLSNVIIKDFPILSPVLLAKAMRRKLLYSRVSHSFLFESNPQHRESVAIQSDAAEPLVLLEKVISALQAAGLRHVDMVDEDDFSYIFLRKDEMNASVSIATSGSTVSIPIVLVSNRNRDVTSLADKIRQALPR
ncbi:MAG: ATP-binding protein, partial [Candidatus Thorarchaeota archaeon]